MKDARKCFLYIGFTIFAISLALLTINEVNSIINSYNHSKNVVGRVLLAEEMFWACVSIFLKPLPLLISELSLIKNGYVILSVDQTKTRKKLCIISSILAIIPIFIVLFADNIFISFANKVSALFVNWLIIVVSFVFGTKAISNLSKYN